MWKKKPAKRGIFFDESRFGTHSKVGQGWFKKGSRSQVKVKIGREIFYLYRAVNLRNEVDVSLLAPHVNTGCMNIFLEQMPKDLRTRKAFLIMDCASWHRSKGLKTPENIPIIYLPPYSPKLNTVEKISQHLKDNLMKNKMYDY